MAEDDKETREQKRRRQMTEIHAALGRYVEAFERIVHWIRAGCILLTAQNVGQQRLMSIVFNHRSMTADNLFRIYQSLVGELVKDRGFEVGERQAIFGVLQQFDTDFQDAVAKRNDLLHGTWFIGFGNESSEDWSAVHFMKFKPNKLGLATYPGPESASDIDVETAECNRLADFFSRYMSCIILDMVYRDEQKTRVLKNFALVGPKKRQKWIAIAKQPTT